MPRLRWVGVISFLVVLVSGCGKDEATGTTAAASTAAPEAATATSETATGEEPASSEVEYLALPPPPLRPGRVHTTDNFQPRVVFRVPKGWNGSADNTSFGVGKGVDLAAEDFDRASIYVYRMDDLPYPKAITALESLNGLKVVSKEPAPPLGGFPGQRYQLSARRPVVLEPLGIVNEVGPGTVTTTIYNVHGTALWIDVSGDTKADRAEAERVLRSFRFPKG